MSCYLSQNTIGNGLVYANNMALGVNSYLQYLGTGASAYVDGPNVCTKFSNGAVSCYFPQDLGFSVACNSVFGGQCFVGNTDQGALQNCAAGKYVNI